VPPHWAPIHITLTLSKYRYMYTFIYIYIKPTHTGQIRTNTSGGQLGPWSLQFWDLQVGAWILADTDITIDRASSGWSTARPFLFQYQQGPWPPSPARRSALSISEFTLSLNLSLKASPSQEGLVRWLWWFSVQTDRSPKGPELQTPRSEHGFQLPVTLTGWKWCF
jgi:hypothetical protein